MICSGTIALFLLAGLHGQDKPVKDAAIYRDYKPGYYENIILKSFSEQKSLAPAAPRRVFAADLSGKQFPNTLSDYRTLWHNEPVSQGITGTCWCYAGVSFMESEIFRLTGQKVRLSQMYFVYWEYVERAMSFVEKRGDMHFGEGSEVNAVPKLIKKYGAVPLHAYPGKPKTQEFHNHGRMVDEMTNYLKGIRESGSWNRELVVGTIRNMLDHYMGPPPSVFDLDGKSITPESYASEILRIKPDDYFSFMSALSLPYNQKGLLDEPDNWWRCDDYYNVNLADFITILNNTVNTGFTAAVCGDVSEPGYDKYTQAGIIPTFDIPSEYIDDGARQYRVGNGATSDDHCLHVVGYTQANGQDWYLIKDSSSSAFDGPEKGYRFLHEDYVRLKILTLLVHKDAAREILDKIIK